MDDYGQEIENEAAEVEEVEEPRKIDIGMLVDARERGQNVVDLLEEEELKKIARQVIEGYEADYASLEGWREKTDDSIKLAMQVCEDKTFPWPGAANVKLPIITVATMQFASRVDPAIIRTPYPVSGRVNGYRTDAKVAAADRMAKHMSWQLTDQMDTWVEDMDKLFHVLPIVGCAYKKTYRDTGNNRNVSELVMPKDVVFDYCAKDIESARRVTHYIELLAQTVKERQLLGVYADVDIATGEPDTERREVSDEIQGVSTDNNYGLKVATILEQYAWFDLDKDGYEEPYIVTVSKEDSKVLRIDPRFTGDSVTVNDDNRVAQIKADDYWTQYLFFPDPSGGSRGIGWGQLLKPVNESVNTIINQLLDAGTMNNVGGGLISKELKLPAGEVRQGIGQWHRVNAMGMQIANAVYPWPTREPSQVLYTLLALLIDWGQRVSAVSDGMTGQSPPSNVPASTTLAMLEQGQKVFQGIYKRIYRALERELKKIKKLNALYMDDKEYFTVLDIQDTNITEEQAAVLEQTGNIPAYMGIVMANDYRRDDTDVTLTAEPQISSEQVSMARIRLCMELKNAGIFIADEYVAGLVTPALGLPDSERQRVLTQPPPPQPNPMEMAKMEEAKAKMQKTQHGMAMEEARIETENKRIDADVALRADKQQMEKARLLMEAEQKAREDYLKGQGNEL